MAHGSERLSESVSRRKFVTASDAAGVAALAGFDGTWKTFENREHRQLENDATGRFG